MPYSFAIWLTTIITLCASELAHGQPTNSPFDLHPPLKGELFLSGSFGEIRTNSFHAGLDFRTGGKIGQEVFASEKGHISRIRVGGTGFGKAIYIQHPNGLTTVYAHLDRFAPAINEYVKELQYERQSFEIDIWVSAKDFPVKRGEFIGLSGNTGSSGGPHLHYEVRSTTNQIPMNPSFSNLPIRDNLKPVINGLWIYPLDDSSYIQGKNNRTELNVQGQNGSYTIKDTIRVQGTIGLGVKAYDYINRGSLRCGIYGIRKHINKRLTYQFSVDEFSFSETRYANSHIDFALRQDEGKRVHKLFREPNNLFSGYGSPGGNGRLQVAKDSVYHITITIEDSYGHTAYLNMVMQGSDFGIKKLDEPTPPLRPANPLWLFYNDNSKVTEWFSIQLPKNSLYDNINFTYQITDTLSGSYSPVVTIHNANTAVHRLYTLSINADSVPRNLKHKALIGTINREGKVESAGGQYTEGWVETQINFFGDFLIAIDTIAPTITPQNIWENKDMKKEKTIDIKAEDDLSGIASIEGTINGNWVLFEHDPKNNLIFYEFDNKRLERNKTHKLKLTVTDNKENTSIFECKFLW
ncbi:MAG: M23 family metallopeptidase [Tenuifilaceae bacterium]|jgi:murein DD-endopeptidase MepM/ murein hydrolase activator NlpD|nr:M23 family metallopeptidase [Tenuifilaceae bacterium]